MQALDNSMLNEELIKLMFEFDHGDVQRIHHFLKVYEFARVIGVSEGLEAEKQKILELASIVHDIGIIPCIQRFGHCNGKMQEEYGPDYARELLKKLPEVTEEETERICFLIAHHHTYEGVDDLDWQILLEADFLVNAFESQMKPEAILEFRNRVFKTTSGTQIFNTVYGLD